MTFHRSSRSDDDGFTVPEVAVTLMILSIVMVIMLQFLTHATDITARSESNSRRETEAQLALRELTAEIRALNPASATACASPLPVSMDDCLAYEINRSVSGLSVCPKTRISLAMEGTAPARVISVVREEFPAGASPTTCDATPASTTRKTVLTKVVNSYTEKLFTYYAGDGSVLNPASAGFTFQSVDAVRVLFFLEYRNAASRLDFRSVIALRNNNNR